MRLLDDIAVADAVEKAIFDADGQHCDVYKEAVRTAYSFLASGRTEAVKSGQVQPRQLLGLAREWERRR